MEVLHVNTQHATGKPIIIRQQNKLPLWRFDRTNLQISKSLPEIQPPGNYSGRWWWWCKEGWGDVSHPGDRNSAGLASNIIVPKPTRKKQRKDLLHILDIKGETSGLDQTLQVERNPSKPQHTAGPDFRALRAVLALLVLSIWLQTYSLLLLGNSSITFLNTNLPLMSDSDLL